jgi:5-methylcytosine-specific restriction protein A
VLDARYCKRHQTVACDSKKQYERFRGSAASRGYDRTWQRFRVWFLERHPLCEDCLEARPQRFEAATEPHHLKKVAEYPELRLVEDNLRALCHDDHSTRTARGE